METPKIIAASCPKVPEFTSPVETFETVECDQISEWVPRAEAEFLQVSPGPSWRRVTRLHLERATLWRSLQSGQTLCRGVPRKGQRYAIIPLSWRGKYIYNGRELLRPMILNQGENWEYRDLNEDCEAANFAFDHALFVEAATFWTGQSPDDCSAAWDGPCFATPLTNGALVALRQTLKCLTKQPDIFQAPEALSSLQHALIGMVIQAGANAGHLGNPVRPARLNQLRLLKSADEYLRGRLGEPVYLLDLCAATGASARAIEYAFREIYGLSPFKYLKLRRLQLARRLLREGDPATMSVKSAALEAGFWDLGRFSIEFRRLFGESPSATLAVARPRPK